MVDQGKQLEEFMAAVPAGRHQRALEIYNKLPQELQQEKAVMINRIRASIEVSDSAYRSAIEDYQAAYPNDPSCQLVCIDLYAMNGEYDKAIAAIKSLNESVGGDAHLYFLQSALLAEQYQYEEAARAIQLAVDKEPEYEAAWLVRANIHAELGNFAKVTSSLREMRDEFEYDIEQLGLEYTPEYREYVKSDEYRELIDEQ